MNDVEAWIMLKHLLLAVMFVVVAWTQPTSAQVVEKVYDPNWESLDQRPNPDWFDDDKIGIFIHWSVFSVPAIAWVYPDKPYGFGGHSCWYGMYIDRLYPLSPPEQAKLEAFHRKTYGDVPFKALAPLFKAEAFDPQQWAELFKRSGARYAFLTSNFHDGYCLWPSPQNPAGTAWTWDRNVTCWAISPRRCGKPDCVRASTTPWANSTIRCTSRPSKTVT